MQTLRKDIPQERPVESAQKKTLRRAASPVRHMWSGIQENETFEETPDETFYMRENTTDSCMQAKHVFSSGERSDLLNCRFVPYMSTVVLQQLFVRDSSEFETGSK